MEISVYDYGRGDLLCTILVDEKDNFCALKEKLREKKKINPQRQKIVLRIEGDNAAIDWQLDEELEKRPVNEAVPECKIFVKLPFAVEEAETNAKTEVNVVIPPENQPWTIPKGQRIKLPSPGELNLLRETKVTNGVTRHLVFQYKEERTGKLSIEAEGDTCKVFYVSDGDVKEDKPLACELKTLDEIEKESWTQWGERLKKFIIFNVELAEIVGRPAVKVIKVCASAVKACAEPTIKGGITFLQSLLGARPAAIQTP